MSYSPTNWQTGDIVTAEKLNKLEQGVAAGGGGVLIVHDTDGVLDKTWQEIYDAGYAVLAGNHYRPMYDIAQFGEMFVVSFYNMSAQTAEDGSYVATSASSYPELYSGGD